MGVSENNGTPKSSILIEFSIINHPFWGIPIFGNTLMAPLPVDVEMVSSHDLYFFFGGGGGVQFFSH